MYKILVLSIVGLLALAFGPMLINLQGEIIVRIAGWEIYTTVSAFVISLLVTGLVLWFITRLIKGIFRRTKISFAWFGGRKEKQAREQTQLALMKFLEGDYRSAEKALIKGAKHADLPALNYLLAAELAQKQGNFEGSQHYLVLASEGKFNSDLALDLTQIRLLVEKNDLSTATVRIERLLAKYPNQPEVLRLASQIYERSHAYTALIALIPILRKQEIFVVGQIQQLFDKGYRGLMLRIINQENTASLIEWWQAQSRTVRNTSECQVILVDTLVQAGAKDEAKDYFDYFLKKQPSSGLLNLTQYFDNLEWDKLDKQLKKLETKISDSNAVKRAQAIVAIHLNEFDRAERLLQAIILSSPTQVDYNLLAKCLESQNRVDEAKDTLKLALSKFTQ